MFTELFFDATLFDGSDERAVRWREVRETAAPVDPVVVASDILMLAGSQFTVALGNEIVRGRFVKEVTAAIGSSSIHRFE